VSGADKKLLIVGSGGHARVVLSAAVKSGYNIAGILDINFTGKKERILNHPVLGSYENLENYRESAIDVFVALGDIHTRSQYYNDLRGRGFNLPTIIHPTSIVDENSIIEPGVLINTGALINAGAKIGENTVINTGAIIEHEVEVGKNSHIAPGVCIGGRSKIGDNTFIGIGVTVIDYITIGSQVKVGAGSVIIDDIESGATVVGVPGKKTN